MTQERHSVTYKLPNSTIFVIVDWVFALIALLAVHTQMTRKYSSAMCYIQMCLTMDCQLDELKYFPIMLPDVRHSYISGARVTCVSS